LQGEQSRRPGPPSVPAVPPLCVQGSLRKHSSCLRLQGAIPENAGRDAVAVRSLLTPDSQHHITHRA
jgi:hypothetical protein